MILMLLICRWIGALLISAGLLCYEISINGLFKELILNHLIELLGTAELVLVS